jgi:DNA repair exonuclease SbcCD ATPase subunit
MTGLSRKNFGMFRKLCGDNALQNVVIVTNMWGEVTANTGNAREAELMREDVFFRPVLEKGAQMARHENTVRSAGSIIRRILNNHPLPLRIQEELVDQHMDISETDAGEELNREINAQIRKHKEEMHSLEERIEQAMKDKDEETRRELEIETEKMQREIKRFQHDSERLESDYKKEKERLEERMRLMELKAREEAERIAAQYQRQIDELKHALDTNTAASERDKAYMRQQISDLSARLANSGRRRRGLLGRIGDAIDSLFF